MKQAQIFYNEHLAGILSETDLGYRFEYDPSYLATDYAKPISLTLPLSKNPYNSNILFPFFDGLIPEGWLLDVGKSYWKLDNKDRFELLITLCKDTIGAVSVIPMKAHE